MGAGANRPADPTLSEWHDIVTPLPGDGDLVEVGRRAESQGFGSIGEVRERVKGLDFLPIDPYVATVGCAISGERVEIPKGETTVEVSVPDFYSENVEVFLGTHNGPGAPMLVILPGIHSSGQSSHTNVFRKMALERGMNYVVLPNSLSEAMLEDKPINHPGNPRVDAESTHQILSQLKESYPEYFQSISVGGYSYGALHGANLVRFDEEKDQRLIDGTLVAISPPQDLDHSMRQLDSLREIYAEGAGSISATGLKYRGEVKKYGYERFLESDLAARGPGTNITEVKISDKYGSRDGLSKLIETIDTQFGHNQLPRNTQEYQDASWWQRHKMRGQHDDQVENMTYGEFSKEWMSKDRWLTERGLTPAQLAEQYSFSEAIKAIDDTPILALASADDYILAPDDVTTLRALETTSGELEVVRVLETGGHVGMTWNPQIQETIADFALGLPA
jgi:predicted alpha/beta-fold hydrolase